MPLARALQPAGALQPAKARARAGRVVAVIGDGALTAGMAFEALNHAGSSAGIERWWTSVTAGEEPIRERA
jgi:deoxyxylulose-5-phosphate synthase